MLQIAACNLNFKKKAFFPEVFSEMFYCNIFLVLLLKGECLGAAIVLFDSWAYENDAATFEVNMTSVSEDIV